MSDEDEPVLKRSKWGTNRYSYNPRNPVGLVLLVVSVVFAGGMLLLMANRAGPFAPPAEPGRSPSDHGTPAYDWPSPVTEPPPTAADLDPAPTEPTGPAGP